jgi:hypothetical protein
MEDELLSALRARIEEDLDGVKLTEEGLAAVVDARYGELTVRVDHEAPAESIRVSTALPPPAGAGTDFLIFCLALNTQYWDVKVGLDDDGLLVVHADTDADLPLEALATVIVDRVETMIELIDEDLVDWLLDRGLGTPTQRARWTTRQPAVEEESDTEA